MGYNIYSDNSVVNSIKVGQIYIANPTNCLSIKNFDSDDTKPKIHRAGSFTVRPVLIVRAPEPWDKYSTVSVCCSTTRDVPSVEFSAGTNSYNFRLHDIRTVNVSSLLKLVGALSSSAIAMCQTIVSAFYGVCEMNVKSRLDELRRFTANGDDKHGNDVRNVYEFLYNKYAYCIDSSYAPDWEPTDKMTENYNQVQSYSYQSSCDDSSSTTDAGKPVLSAPKSSKVKSATSVALKSVGKSLPIGRQRSVYVKFIPSPATRAWRPTEPTRKPIELHVAECLYLSGFVTCEAMATKFGVSRYIFDKRSKDAVSKRFADISTAAWSTDIDMYSQFRTWWSANNLETTGYFKRNDIEAMFPLIRDSLVPKPLNEAKIQCTTKAQFYVNKLTLCEIIEIVPLMGLSKLMELTGANVVTAKELKEYCTKCREVHLAMCDCAWDEKIAKIRLYLTPNNIVTMPAWMRSDFMAIPKEKLKNYCESLPGWTGYNFDEIYDQSVEVFTAKK